MDVLSSGAEEEELRRRILAQQHPYGLALDAQPARVEYGQPDAEQVTLARWRPLLEEHGAVVWQVHDRLTTAAHVMVAGVPWTFRPLAPGERVALPRSVLVRLKALEGAGVPFTWWVLGTEERERPQFIAAPEAVPERAPASHTAQRALRNAGSVVWQIGKGAAGAVGDALTVIGEGMELLGDSVDALVTDPCLVAVIPTSLAPARGLWVVVGKWPE